MINLNMVKQCLKVIGFHFAQSFIFNFLNFIISRSIE